MAITSIVFDVGQVLFAYNPSKVIHELLPHTPHKNLHLTHLFDAPIWQEMDRGDVTRHDALKKIGERVNHHPEVLHEMGLLIDGFPLHLDLIEDSKILFDTLCKTHDVYILSNFQDEPFDLLLRHYPFMNQAKGMVVSAKVNLAKPERAIYTHLLQTFNLDPSSCVFIDDREENIEACIEVGMKGIVFKSPDQTKIELTRLGVL